jgi:hypothetical protein
MFFPHTTPHPPKKGKQNRMIKMTGIKDTHLPPYY